MIVERIAMPATDRYYSPEEWPRAKFPGQETPKYYESWLHHEGLKCVTDGMRYHLDPESYFATGPLPAAVPVSVLVAPVNATGASPLPLRLPPLNADVDICLFCIAHELAQDDFDRQVVIFSEQYVGKRERQLEYWELFLEKDEDESYRPASKIFLDKRRVTLYLDTQPPPEELPPEPSPEQDEGYYSKTIMNENKRDSKTQPEECDLSLSLSEGLLHFHLEGVQGNVHRLFSDPHYFLIVGNQVYFITNLKNAWFTPAGRETNRELVE